jgi:heme/copper-type cytochrome/quinol oxidase subunit 2
MAVGFSNIKIASTIGVFAMLVGIFWAYKIRKNTDAGGLIWNHAQWMIRTFWVSSVYAVIAMALWSSTVYSNADFTSLVQYKDMLKTGQVDPALIENSAREFAETNRTLMLGSTIGFHGPVILFVLARFFKGYRLADAGRPIENLKSWKLG